MSATDGTLVACGIAGRLRRGSFNRAHEKFDEQGRLTDGKTGEFVDWLLQALADWTRRPRRKSEPPSR